ncbi:hypothetical protein RHGRI_030608 [Rhododendron griersonianum]|uniref:Uncharacterized protein n=1 Tax=Rhododendron griersonianum TaxID=479676 RepID=A0AAV6I526_9ERIC|nr:hypothetical protein RHGRI_030608 [Rhododendron griersonianum]
MADGTISFAEGLGCKALDSNEMRRQQKNARSSLTNSTHKPFDLCPSKDSSPNPPLSNDSKRTSPSRKLQQVFEKELLREAESQQRLQLTLENSRFQLMDLGFPSLSKPTVSSPGFGAHSPKSKSNPSTSRQLQQALFEDGLVLEVEAKAVGQLQGQLHEVSPSNLIPKTLFNARGILYLEGDPNMGYSEADTNLDHHKIFLNKFLLNPE